MLYRLLPYSVFRQLPPELQRFLASGSDAIVLYVLLGVFAWLAFRFLRPHRRGGGTLLGPALVLRRFTVDEGAANIVHIVGRKPGLIAWVLTAVGLDAETSLTVNDREVLFTTSRLSGRVYQLVPLPSVASTHCGYHKSLGWLVCGIAVLVVGLLLGVNGSGAALIGGLVLGLVLIVAYALSKSMVISVETAGGMFPLGLRFKPSVLEGKPVDIRAVLRAVQLINQRVVAAQARQGPATTTSRASTPQRFAENQVATAARANAAP